MINVAKEGHRCDYSIVYFHNEQLETKNKKDKIFHINYKNKIVPIKICFHCKTLFIGDDNDKNFDLVTILYSEQPIIRTLHYCNNHNDTTKYKLYLMHYRIGSSFITLKYRFCMECNTIYDLYRNGTISQRHISVIADHQRELLQYQVNHLFDIIATEQVDL
jgi:hypothetical protein